MIPTVKQLRQSGYKVRVLHTRNYKLTKRVDGDSKELCAKGGITTIEITTPNGKNVTGVAHCSDCDSYNKRLGVRIAVGRALSQVS
jgi:hypothetical protein